MSATLEAATQGGKTAALPSSSIWPRLVLLHLWAFQSPADGEIPLSLLPITALQKKDIFASEAWYLSFVGFSDVAAERRGETEACKRNVADNL